MTETITISSSPDTVVIASGGQNTSIEVLAGSPVTLTLASPVPIPGPQGPEGPAGPAGPQGPAGAASVTSVNGQTGTVDLTATSLGLAIPVTVPVMMPSATWSITHDFPYNPTVAAFDPSGNEICGDITFPDGQTVVISWAGAQSGSVELS